MNGYFRQEQVSENQWENIVNTQIRTFVGIGLAIAIFAVLPGCMTVSDRQDLVPNADASATFGNRTLAVLPVND